MASAFLTAILAAFVVSAKAASVASSISFVTTTCFLVGFSTAFGGGWQRINESVFPFWKVQPSRIIIYYTIEIDWYHF